MSREMNVEENRLKTFSSWPVDDATRFAKAGFYYTGRDREMQCFFCGAILSDATSGDKLPLCHQFSCLLAADLTSRSNIPLASAVNINVLESTSSSSQPSDASTNNTDILQRPLDPRRTYETVEQRLVSFKNWPVPFIVRPEQLASAGFYYLQYKDVVECIFCGGALMNWRPNQDPDALHKLCFPNCDFYMNQELDETIINLESLLTPTNPNYGTYEKRLETFTCWPKQLKQSPKILADAGFFYIGYKDYVKCFHCNGVLGNWEPTDDVWVEHARFFAKCEFVKFMRGQKFAKQCINNRKPLDLSIFSKMPVNESGNFIETPTTLQANNPIIHDTANSKQDVKSLIPSLSTVVQVSSSVTNATNSAKDVTESIVASSECSKLRLKTILKRLLENTNVDSDMTETELLLFMTHVKEIHTSLKKRLEETGKSGADINQLMRGVLRIFEDVTLDKDNPNLESL